MCDAGDNYYSHVIYLITQLDQKEDKTISKCTPLLIKSWTATKGFSTPETELLALVTLIKTGNSILDILQKAQIKISIDEMYFVSDSTCAILWMRSFRVQFEKRVQCLISKGQTWLFANNESPYFHI